MFNHKGIDIKLFEGTSYSDEDVELTSDNILYVAKSKYGKSFANTPDKALSGAKEQINQNVK